MKRPFALAIFAFAGGEALYETAGCGIMAGTVIAVSVFSVLILFRYGRGRAFLPILISFLLGFFSAILMLPGKTGADRKLCQNHEDYTVTTGDNPGAYDRERQEKIQKPFETVTQSDVVSGLREGLSEKLYGITDENTAALLTGILLGDKTGIDREVRTLYRAGGISHVLAISGLHVSMLGGAVNAMLLAAGLPFAMSGGITVVLMICYGLLTGLSFSTLRAIIMLALAVLGHILGRHYDMMTGAALALMFILLGGENRLFDTGLVLSFGAVLGVCLGTFMQGRFERTRRGRLFKKYHKLRFRLCRTAIMTIALNSVLTPLVLYFYCAIPTYAILINLLVCLLLPVIVGSGAASLLVSFVSPFLAGVIVFPAKLVLSLYESLLTVSLSLPGSVLCVGHVSVIALAVYYACLLFTVYLLFGGGKLPLRRRIRVSVSCLTILIGIGAFCVSAILIRRERIVLLDVGQGDGILIRMEGGANVVIDGGSVSEKQVGTYVLAPALKYYGMDRVDYWCVSHADTDHISGLIYVLEQGISSGVEIDHLVFSEAVVKDENYRELILLAKARGIPVLYLGAGDCIESGTSRLCCVFPTNDFRTEDKNEASLVLLYESDALCALFTGDLGTEAIKVMFTRGNRLLPEAGSLDLLKIPHHGSRNSLSEDLYAMLKEDGLAIISCGKHSTYGHPHKEVTDALEASDIPYLRTDQTGAVIITPR